MIVIGGTPGVGKTTVAKKLEDELELKRQDLMKFAEEIGAIEGEDEERNSLNVNMEKVSKEISSEGKIVDSHMGHLIGPKKVKYLFILRCRPDELKERLESRDWSEEKVKENIRTEILDTCLVEAVQKGHTKYMHEIDTTNKEVEKIVEEIEKVIDGEKDKEIGKVDWGDYVKEYM